MTSGSYIVTDAQAIFCFSPPERWKRFRPSSGASDHSRVTCASRLLIFSAGHPMFSQPKTTSPVESTLKNCDRGFWKTEPTERAVS